MKTIGLLGGMSWQSTLSYYKTINEIVSSKLGGLNSAKIAMKSVNFTEIEILQKSGNWQDAASMLLAEAQSIERAGADFLLICTNTMHKVADQIEKNINIPLVHIADATGEVLKEKNITKVGLLGTAFTMEESFYKNRLMNKFAIEPIVPTKQNREHIHNIIYNELCNGQIKSASKQRYLSIIEELRTQGAQAVILGCTEIGLLVNQSDTDIWLVDTAQVHAEKAVALSIAR